MSGEPEQFFRVPPFPGSARPQMAGLSADGRSAALDLDRLVELTAQHRVGGTFWAAQPDVGDPPYVLVKTRHPDRRAQLMAAAGSDRLVVWADRASHPGRSSGDSSAVAGPCDPWHLVSGASQLFVDADDEVALIAGIAGVPVECLGEGPFRNVGRPGSGHVADAFRRHVLDPYSYQNPFTGEAAEVEEIIDISAFWRGLIDSNRDLDAAFGFAGWKRATAAPMLWNGSGPVPFRRRAESGLRYRKVAIWKSRAAPAVLARLEESGAELIEVEDGFIRSTGLGADCVPPLSIVVDRLGAHFDPRQPSELELILEQQTFPDPLVDRARRLRELVVSAGVSKYGTSAAPAARRADDRRHILVPGQVEDDRSVLSGGAEVRTNLELLRRVRKMFADAYIIYKPHPDVEAGHRLGVIPDTICLSLADEIAKEQGISPLIAMVDELHVNTSLAGFEALLRGKQVTTHGVPFYAGWGLTHDLGSVPDRRTRRRTLDELVAAVLLIYPRYLDPDTGLPCPPEILIHRLSQPASARKDGPIIRLRRIQGRLKRWFGAIPSP